MANTKSAKIATRKIARRTETNTDRKSRIRTFIKKVESAIENGNKEEATTSLKTAESEIMRGVKQGIYKLNTAARKVSRLSKRVKTL